MPGIRKNMCDMIKKYMAAGALLVPAVLICFPVFLILTGSVMDGLEMKAYLAPEFGDGEGYIRWKVMPDYPTFEHYGRLLFMTPSFFVLFWNSVKLVLCILAGQLLVGVPAAWAFAAYSVRGSRALFALYVVLMLLPFQVTMLSSYLVLDRLTLMNTHAAIILPAVFSTLPIFLSYGGFRAIPPQLFEAARIDGAGELKIFLQMVMPALKPATATLTVFSFVNNWNDYFSPLIYVTSQAMKTLPLALQTIGGGAAGMSVGRAGAVAAATFLMTAPTVIIFVIKQGQVMETMTYSGIKG